MLKLLRLRLLQRTSLICLLVSSLFVTGCAVIALGGAVTGTAVVLDSRDVNTQIDDSGLRLRVSKALNDDHELKQQRIVVVAYNNDILLIGQVINQELKQKAERLAREAGQPLHLFNELTVGNLARLTDRSKDSWITTRIKSQLLSDPDYDTSGIKVITENQDVFLLGVVSEEVAAHAVEVARHTNGVKRVIRVFNLI